MKQLHRVVKIPGRIVAPSRGRGLKLTTHEDQRRRDGRPLTGARIETVRLAGSCLIRSVAPSRGRGLKPTVDDTGTEGEMSPPHGGAD